MTPTNRPQTREAAPLPTKDHGAARKQKGSSSMCTSPTRSITRSATVGQVATVVAAFGALAASLASYRAARQTRRRIDAHSRALALVALESAEQANAERIIRRATEDAEVQQ